MGSPIDFNNFMTAVIHKDAFERISNYIKYAQESKDCDIIHGGNCDDSVGYFVEPTIIITKNAKFKGIAKATTLPKKELEDIESPTIIKIPLNARKIDINPIKETFSFK